jgi:hypothetical protein
VCVCVWGGGANEVVIYERQFMFADMPVGQN